MTVVHEIDYDRWNENAKQVLLTALECSRATGAGHRIGTEHLLEGLILSGMGPALFDGVDVHALREQARSAAAVSREVGVAEPFGEQGFTLTEPAVTALALAARESGDHVTTQDLLVGLTLAEDGGAARLLAGHGVTTDHARGALDRLMAVFAEGPWGGTGPVDPVPDPDPDPVLVRIRELTAEIRAIRRAKEEAIDAQDFTRAAAERDVEKGLLAERAALVDEVRPPLDVAALLDELELLRDEVVRLRARLERGTP
jgi:hypothetical protein